MMKIRRFVLALVAASAAALGNPSPPAHAATRTWVGGNDPWDADIFNWSGNDEPDPDDDVVFNTNNSVDMAMDNEILSLDMSNGIELDTETYFLDVNGDVALSDSGTIFRAGENDLAGLPATSVSAHNITVGDGATYANANFTSIVHPTTIGVFDINSGATLHGNGTIRSGDGVPTPTVVLENDGVIRPGNVVDGFIIVGAAPPSRTLTLSAIDGDARIDLDGSSGGGAIDLTRNQTLDINIELDDDFDGVIDLAHNATLDIEDAWEFAGTMNVENGFVPESGTFPFIIPAIPADVAYLQGGEVTMNEATSTINVLDSDGTLQFDAAFTANDGTINNNGLVVFNADATINSNVDFQMTGLEADMTVGPGATVVINDADMDFDGSGANTNVITVEAGGLLELNLDSFEGNDRADGFMTLNSGELRLTVTDGSWTIDRRLTLNNSGGGSPVLSGSAVVIGGDSRLLGTPDADVRVEGSGSSQINPPVTWNSDAEVDVAAGATLAVLGFSTFNTVNGADSAQFDGPGDIFFSGGQVNEEVVLNFSGGTVGLDGGGALVILLSAPDFTIDAPLTINAAELDQYGRTIVVPTPQTSELTVNANVGGQLNVNLDNPADSWRVNDAGIVNINGGNIVFTTFLTGNHLNMDGTMTVDGFSRSDARMTLGATGVVNFNDAAANLRFSGGDLANTNRLEGGTINGTGEISSTAGKALHGHGTISATIDFDGDTSELMADDGTLTISDGSSILDVGVIGTAGSDAVLDVGTPWDTSVAAEVRLHGGEITGGTIQNFGPGGIRGEGLISARVRNETAIVADVGGNLEINNPLNSNDWDGPGNAGVLRAEAGSTLQLHDNAAALFTGTVEANNATVRTVGFELEFDPGSTLALENGGTYRSTNATDIGGTVLAGPGAPSRLQVAGTARFESSSSTTLTSDLVGDNATTRVEAGATFAGGGALINPVGSVLVLEDGADVDVLVRNDGSLAVGNSPGQTTGTDFEQTASGVIQIELEGTGLSDYDRMSLDNLVQLDGELRVLTGGGFVPALNDTFTIFTANNVAGTFDTEVFTGAPLDPGLAWDVLYNATNVQLAVINAPAILAGDYNDDGIVNAADYTEWRDNLGAPAGTLPNDVDGVVVGQAQYITWKSNFGMSLPPATSLATVPEPSTCIALLLGTMAVCSRRYWSGRSSPAAVI